MRPEARTAGYTLIEVLVAFVILALALTVILRIFSGGVRSISVSEDYVTALLIAETMLSRAGVDERLVAGQTSGLDGGDFAWVRTVEPYVPTADYTPAVRGVAGFHVTVSVEWAHSGGVRKIDLSTVKLRRSGELGS